MRDKWEMKIYKNIVIVEMDYKQQIQLNSPNEEMESVA